MNFYIDILQFPQNITIYLYRLDKLHKEIGGNKFFKLKYNIEQAKKEQKNTILTFGGAFSNHIWATAAAGYLFDFQTIGIIRGEETLPLNPVLTQAKNWGMQFYYVNRNDYKILKSNTAHWQNKFGKNTYILPEGGSNAFAVKGCIEIMEKFNYPFDYVCTPCGTGGTLAGLVASPYCKNKKIIGFPVLKGGIFLKDEIKYLIEEYQTTFETNIEANDFELQTEYHAGGYAKIPTYLKEFSSNFFEKYGLKLDEIYTAKCLFGVFDLMNKDFFEENSNIVVLITQREQ
jgi:1-aminocyclopropane-1-carboxylate deaminase/D-cysteine desulfhydrase-like pyridoxal-dependent ACC family enzyme